MLRIALAVGLATYVAIATGEVTAFSAASCSQRCPDDDAQGKCAPDCADCACCPHLRLSFAVAEMKVSAPVQGDPVPEHRQTEPQSPEPGDILHVPKTLLA